MPLPLPDLDTRSWADLVEEGRDLVPVYAADWTELNYSDPGITLLELLAWLVEQDIYRVNRVPDRHRRKFLELVGFDPQPARPASTVLAFTLAPGSAPLDLPAGVALVPEKPAEQLRFRTRTDLRVSAARLQALLTFDGRTLSDRTAVWQGGGGVALLGPDPVPASDPELQPSFYLGFDPAPSPNEQLSLWLAFAGRRTDDEERRRIAVEAEEQAELCLPQRPPLDCDGAAPEPEPDDSAGEAAVAAHHSVRTVWEFWDGGAWTALDAEAGEVDDRTRGLTLDGAVLIRLPVQAQRLALAGHDLFFVRCRLAAGRPDEAPLLVRLAANAVVAEQASTVREELPLSPGVVPPPPGTQGEFALALDPEGVLTAIAPVAAGGVEATVLATSARSATLTFAFAGTGTGLPRQELLLREAPVADGRIGLYELTPAGVERWEERRDLDASRRHDSHFTLEPQTGLLSFGDGEHGRVLPAGAVVLAAYATTAGAGGNVPAGLAWLLAGADDVLNRQLLQAEPRTVQTALSLVANPTPAVGGSDDETVDHAAGRAAAELWSHERLVELCPASTCATLDQLPQDEVLRRQAPWRAANSLDFERLALDVPGTRVRRARAWPVVDPSLPCLRAPGTVTVVVVPSLPRGRPVPTPGLLRAVDRYLRRRRTICTRLLVVGPDYVEVTVTVRVQARPGADPARVKGSVDQEIRRFLDPLEGGPAGLGWPFGRDVYRSEILQVVDGVTGVDHVLSLELRGPDEARCDNLCIPPTSLVASGAHLVEVVEP